MWWFSAAFTAFLVVTVVGVSIWFLPHMFTPPLREPDFEDVDELARRCDWCGRRTTVTTKFSFPFWFHACRQHTDDLARLVESRR